MKNLKNIFSSLLLIALAIILSGCNSTHTEASIETTVIHEEYIEIEATEATFPIETQSIIETVPVETEPQIFDKNITYDISYVNEEEIMPYALLTPSTVADNSSIPLIVWLHGRDEHNLSEEEFLETGLASIILNCHLENFNAYIICPQMKESYYVDYWCNSKTKTDLTNLLDNFISEHNVDQDKIIVAGANLGAQGALYMSVEMVDYFDCAVVFSPYSCGIQCSEIEIPVMGYYAFKNEPEEVSWFMRAYFSREENCRVKTIDVSRYELPEVVFNLDKNHNGKADIVEWMLLGESI